LGIHNVLSGLVDKPNSFLFVFSDCYAACTIGEGRGLVELGVDYKMASLVDLPPLSCFVVTHADRR
jgi:hypothetical protein